MRFPAIILALLALALPAQAREGFGFTKKAVNMVRTKPPSLQVGARRVKVAASSERSSERDDAQTLRRYVEEQILNGAGTLATEKDKGEIGIKIALDRFDSDETWETTTKLRYQKTGTKQEWNAKKQKYETKDVYDNVPYTVNVKVVSANLSGAFDILDKTGKVIESADLREEYKERFEQGTNAPIASRLEDDLLKKAAVSVASRLVPTQDRVSVLVPKGSFETLIPLAEMNAWDQYLAGVEAVAPKRDVRQEAYRQYALGVAKEGLAYASDDRARTIELLRDAVAHYQTAIRSHPGEKIFAEAYSSLLSAGAGAPLPRAQVSLGSFENWSGKGTASPTRTVAASRASLPAPGSSRMTNQTLIEMSQAGLKDENLILAIDAAGETEFDTTPQALIALAKGGVSKSVIAHIQKKSRGRG